MNDDPIDAPCAARSETALTLAEVAHVLSELYELLEEYAPSWYTKEHHDKAVAALRLAKGDT